MNDTPFSKGCLFICLGNQQESESAIQYGCPLAQRLGLRVALVTVVEPVEFQGLQSVTDKMNEEKREQAETLLQSYAGMAKNLSGQMPELVMREGIFIEELVKLAGDAKGEDLIALTPGSHAERTYKTLAQLATHLTSPTSAAFLLIPSKSAAQPSEEAVSVS
jgi:nucleotide-binding universal stress UspA family protein